MKAIFEPWMLQVKSRVTVRVVVPRIGRRALKAQCCTCLTSFHGHVLLILFFLLAAWFSGSLLSTFFFKVKIKKSTLGLDRLFYLENQPGCCCCASPAARLDVLCGTAVVFFEGRKKIEKENWLHFLPPVAEGCCS